MKKSIIVIFIITALCPLNMMAQLELNSTFNKKDTVLNVSLENIGDKNHIVLFCDYVHAEGSTLELFFLDNKNNIITNSLYGFIVNDTSKSFIQINPKQKLDFRFGFTSVKKYYNLKNLKKIRVKIWLKYLIDNDKGYGKDFIREFTLE